MIFTGSPSEQALKQQIINMLSLNELLPNQSPYGLSFSTGTTSGYSFGYPQFDLGQGNSTINGVFSDIVENATDVATGQFFIDPNLTGSERTAAESGNGQIAQLILLAEQSSATRLVRWRTWNLARLSL